MAALGLAVWPMLSASSSCSDSAREEDREYRATPSWPSATPHLNPSPMFVDDAFGEPETKPCSRVFLGGVERLENAGEILPKNAAAVIGKNHAYSLAQIS